MIELKKERRNGLLLGAVGVVIAILLVVLYLSQSQGDEAPVTPSRQVSPEPPVAAPPSSQVGAIGATPAASATAETAPAVVKSATVKTLLTKKTMLWIDGRPVTHGKDLPVDVPAGPHEVKLKLGKKSATQQVDFKPGANYELRFDPKNEKTMLKELR